MWVVGVGPGDPKLLTLAALEVLQKAKLIFAPLMGSETSSRAFRIVQPFLPDNCRVVQLRCDRDEEETLQTLWNEMVKCTPQEAVFLVLGDSLLYSSFFKLLSRIRERKSLEIEIVPGISAYQVMGARLGVPLVQDDEVLSIVPGNIAEERFRALFELSDTLILYKLSLLFKQNLTIPQNFWKGWVGENLSTSEEKIYPLFDNLHHLPYFSMAILKKSGFMR